MFFFIGKLASYIDNEMTMTIKNSLFDINHLNTMLGDNKAEK